MTTCEIERIAAGDELEIGHMVVVAMDSSQNKDDVEALVAVVQALKGSHCYDK